MKKILSIILCLILQLGVASSIAKADAKSVSKDLVCNLGDELFQNYDMDYFLINEEERNLYLGRKIQLNVTNSKEGMVWKWKGKTPDIGTITQEGLITLKTTGAFKAKGTCELDGNTYVINYAAYVKEPHLSVKKIKLAVGQQYGLKLIGADVKSYQSSQKKIASISKKGMITAKKAGKCKIAVKDTNGKKYNLKLTVYKNKSSKHYNSCLKTKDGKVIIRYNKLTKKVMKSKVKAKKNSYLQKTSEAYYYIQTKDGLDVVLQATKKPLEEECYFHGKKDKISTTVAVGPLGQFKGIVGEISCFFRPKSQYVNYATNQGTFDYDTITYYYGETGGDKKGDTYADNEIFTMKKNGYYFTLYTYNLKKHRRRYDLDKIADALFQ